MGKFEAIALTAILGVAAFVPNGDEVVSQESRAIAKVNHGVGGAEVLVYKPNKPLPERIMHPYDLRRDFFEYEFWPEIKEAEEGDNLIIKEIKERTFLGQLLGKLSDGRLRGIEYARGYAIEIEKPEQT